jgi:SAM-dependent methyltransferase
MSRLIYPEPRPLPTGAPPLPRENVYGHVQRLDWLASHIEPSERVVEFGCGTGYMITYPLRVRGYEVVGVDIDSASIEYGRGLLERAGIDPNALQPIELREVDGPLDAVIASEVLEHLEDRLLTESLRLIYDKLRPGGKLLVTVPNGWGLFELEALLWNRLGIGGYVVRRGAQGAQAGRLAQAKDRATHGYVADACPSTLAQSPHVQRFTLRSIQRAVAAQGFATVEARGSVAVCGPLSDLAVTGLPRVMDYNRRCGRRMHGLAAGFYVAAVRR